MRMLLSRSARLLFLSVHFQDIVAGLYVCLIAICTSQAYLYIGHHEHGQSRFCTILGSVMSGHESHENVYDFKVHVVFFLYL